MPLYGNFQPETVKMIDESLSFVKKKIEEFVAKKKEVVDESHHGLIDKEYKEKTLQLDEVRTFLAQNIDRDLYEMNTKSHESLMDIVKSALEIYLKDTLKAKAETKLPIFDAKIQEIQRITNLEDLRQRKTDLFDKYYQSPIQGFEGKEVEIFISYATENKVLAGKIAALLIKRNIDAFLAHEDIEISEEWRGEILNHLRNDSILLALLTVEYQKSVWGNQEAGYVIGKGGKIIPLIVRGIDLKDFGLIESYQGLVVDEKNLESCVDKIVDMLLR
jgi:hypothetical protein